MRKLGPGTRRFKLLTNDSAYTLYILLHVQGQRRCQRISSLHAATFHFDQLMAATVHNRQLSSNTALQHSLSRHFKERLGLNPL